MAAISAYLKDKLMNHSVGITSFTMPTNIKVALYHDNPTVDDTGTEVTGGSYAQQTFGGTTSTAGAGSSANTAAVVFSGMPDCTSNPITHVGVRDATANELLWFGPLATPKTPSPGDSVTITAGQLVLTWL